MKIRHIIPSILLLLFFSCQEENMAIIHEKKAADVTSARFIIPPVVEDGSSKSSLTLEGSVLKFSWGEEDAIGVYPLSTGTGLSFGIKSGAGTNSAKFDGAGWTFKSGQTYLAFAPFHVSYLVNDNPYSAIPCSYEGQVISGNNAVDHLGRYDYLSAQETIGADEDEIVFNFQHTSAFLHFLFSTEKNEFSGVVKIVPMYEKIPLGVTLDLSNNSLKTYKSKPEFKLDIPVISDPLSLYLAMAPKDYSGDAWGLVLLDEKGSIYSKRITGPNLKGGRLTNISTELTPYTVDDNTTITVHRVVQNSLTDLGVASGSNSGIVYVSDGRYALADDGSLGCGIYFLDIVLDESTLTITEASKSAAPGMASDPDDRDTEGIAYNGVTFFTSGESKQNILEYDASGVKTGRSLSVPADLGRDYITGNKGFEALTYNAVTGKYWTVTESPTNADVDILPHSSMLRLQNFDDESLLPMDRFLYMMDAPISSTNVFGVPDMIALDDGKLIVMERERAIPGTILNGWVKIKLYLVDPVHDSGAVLSKHLITEIITSTTSLSENYVANYEGLCLGPALSNGNRTILLVNDSNQGTTSGAYKIKDFLSIIEISGL